ncbi:unnamed protein product [Trifolium pratense]|uniref:Uncharacterized protein n=1 Tax=Trifolium pratense TaxID=57577 RepID=A0ACB0I7S5_TRIPR|nr:unnamed protein product [Trifolium pratense]
MVVKSVNGVCFDDSEEDRADCVDDGFDITELPFIVANTTRSKKKLLVKRKGDMGESSAVGEGFAALITKRNDGNACVDAGTNKVNATAVTKPKKLATASVIGRPTASVTAGLATASIPKDKKPLLKHLGLQRRTSGSLKNCNVKNLKGSGSSSNVPRD